MRATWALATWAGLAALGTAQEPTPSRAKLGETIAGLTFRSADGKEFSLDKMRGAKATVVAFLSFECPVSNSYAQPLSDLANELREHGVAFVGLTTNEDESPAQVAAHAKEFRLTFPLFLDVDLRAARALSADVTPEVFVLDAAGALRYRGRIDNAYSARLKKHAEATRQDLQQALGELVSGRPVSTAATLPIGCPVPREPKAVAVDGPVTYTRDVAPILQKHCQTCHRPGEAAPFSLMNYRQAVNWAADLKTFTQNRTMPPWKPSAGAPLQHERRMSDAEIAALAAWVDGGTPRGKASDEPAPRKFVEGWQLGVPDLVLAPPDDFVLGPTGRDRFQCFVLPTNLPHDVYVTAVEFRPGNPRVVHHLLLLVDASGAARRLEANAKTAGPDAPHLGAKEDAGPGYTVGMGLGIIPQGGLSGWSPGITPNRLPEGTGFYLPKGSDLVMQIHYHRNGRLERDRTQVGLYFSKKPAEKPFLASAVAGGRGSGPLRLLFAIPPGDADFRVDGHVWATHDFELHSLVPHMHLIGKSIRLTMTPPGEAERTLLAIDAWDYNWQEIYFLKEPIAVKKGTRFRVEASFDNSASNPANPFSPPRRITVGEQTNNEMCFVFFGGTATDGPALLRGRALPLSPVGPKR